MGKDNITRNILLPGGKIAENVHIHGFWPYNADVPDEQIERWADEAVELFQAICAYDLVIDSVNTLRENGKDESLEIGRYPGTSQAMRIAATLNTIKMATRIIFTFSDSETVRRLSNDFDTLGELQNDWQPAIYDPNVVLQMQEFFLSKD